MKSPLRPPRLVFFAVLLSFLPSCVQVPEQHPTAVAGGSLKRGFLEFPPHSPDYDTPPIFLKGDAPVYPWPLMMAPAGPVQGYAILTITVDEKGRAVHPLTEEASHKLFASGVATSLPTWRFTPAQKDGKPVAATVKQRFDFGPNEGHLRPR